MIRNWWKRHGGMLLASLFAGGVAIAVLGFMAQGKGFLNAAHLALQLIVLNVDLSNSPINWQLQMTRFALPGIAAYATISSFLALAGYHFHFLKLKWRPPQSLFLGAGRITVGLVGRLKSGRPVVAMDLDIDQVHARALASRGVELIRGDATNSEMLHKLNATESEVIYVLTGDDQRNLDVAHEICSLIGNDQRKPRLVIGMTNSTLMRIAYQDPEFVDYRRNDGWIIWFNAPAQAARALLRDFPPDREIVPEASSPPLHIGVVGFGVHGQAIVLQAIRTCVFADERPISITVFGEDRQVFDNFLLRYPAIDPAAQDLAHRGFTPVADVRFVSYSPGAAAPASLRLAQSDAPRFAIIYVALDDDYHSLTGAWRFRQMLLATDGRAKVVCCLPGTRFGRELDARPLTNANADAYRGIELFHSVSRSVQAGETYPGETSDRPGVAIDAAYRAAQEGVSLEQVSASLSGWETAWKKDLAEDFRWSSRYSADHIPVKLRTIGFDLVEGEGVGATTSEADRAELKRALERNLDLLERMEHRRFCIERLLDGWLYSPSGSKIEEDRNKKRQLNRTLVPFDQLPSPFEEQEGSERDKDTRIARIIPDVVARSGLHLIRRDQRSASDGSAHQQ